MQLEHAKDVLAAGLTAGSGVTATWTWIAPVNDALQLVATTVAIIAGIYAIRWHRVRIANAQKKGKANERKSK